MPGRLEVVCGSMFSGKSEELIRRLRRAHYAKIPVQAFKHSFDNRNSLEHISSHNGTLLHAIPCRDSHEVKRALRSDVKVIGIDEAQFFDADLVSLIHTLVRKGVRVIVAGLDMDFRGIPFGIMPTLMALADEVQKLKAVCAQTGAEAHFTQRLVNGKPARHSDPIILVGAQEHYEARSRESFEIDSIPLDEYIEFHHKNI